MKLNHVFIFLLLSFISASVKSQDSIEFQKLKYQLATQKLLTKSENVTDPTLMALLASQARTFAKKYGFEKDIEADLFAAAIKSRQLQIYDSILLANQAITYPVAEAKSDSLLNEYHGHYPKNTKYQKTVAVRSVFVSMDEKHLYSAGGDGKILKWNINTRDAELIYQNEKINRIIDISKDEKWLAITTNDNEVIVIGLSKESDEIIPVEGHRGQIMGFQFLPEQSAFITVGVDRKILLHTFNSSEPKLLSEYPAAPTSMTITKDGSMLAIGSRTGEVVLFDLNDPYMDPRNLFFGDKDKIALETIQFSPSGELLAVGGSETESGHGFVRLWDVKEKRLFGPDLVGFTSGVQILTFDENETYLAAGSTDHTARVWFLNPDRIFDFPIVLDGQADWVWSVDFDPSGKQLYTASADGKIRRYFLDYTIYLKDICHQISRNLTPFEWQTYVGSQDEFPYQKTCSNLD